MADPGKGSKRRPNDRGKFSENFDRIFGKKKPSAGRRYYRWNSETRNFDEVDPPKPLSSDLRFEGTFVSPVTGEVISNKYDLDRHNKEHGVEQILPGMEQDQAAIRQQNYDAAHGKQAKEDRIKDVIKAIEQGERSA